MTFRLTALVCGVLGVVLALVLPEDWLMPAALGMTVLTLVLIFCILAPQR